MCPIVGSGLPKNVAPVKFQPSPLRRWASYNCPKPNHGWCGLTNSMAWPDFVREGAMAQAFEPVAAAIMGAVRGM